MAYKLVRHGATKNLWRLMVLKRAKRGAPKYVCIAIGSGRLNMRDLAIALGIFRSENVVSLATRRRNRKAA